MAKKQTGIQKKQQLSDEMAEFMGCDKASRAEIVQELWKYIKKHKLQDPDNKRSIDLDDTLSELLGPSRTDMFKLAGLITPHILKD